jgi:hypothetical protein
MAKSRIGRILSGLAGAGLPVIIGRTRRMDTAFFRTLFRARGKRLLFLPDIRHAPDATAKQLTKEGTGPSAPDDI